MVTHPAAEEEIARLAYHIYQAEGCPEGKSAEHWARAERCWREQRMPVPERHSPQPQENNPV